MITLFLQSVHSLGLLIQVYGAVVFVLQSLTWQTAPFKPESATQEVHVVTEVEQVLHGDVQAVQEVPTKAKPSEHAEHLSAAAAEQAEHPAVQAAHVVPVKKKPAEHAVHLVRPSPVHSEHPAVQATHFLVSAR